MRIFLFLSLLSFVFSCKIPQAQVTKIEKTARPGIHEYSGLYGEKDTTGVPIMHFEERTLNLGKVKHGDKKSFDFPFKNIGDADLSISIITACECTSTNQDDLRGKIYKPGEGGVLKVTFDSEEKPEGYELIDIEIILDQFFGSEEIPIIEKVYYDFEIEKL